MHVTVSNVFHAFVSINYMLVAFGFFLGAVGSIFDQFEITWLLFGSAGFDFGSIGSHVGSRGVHFWRPGHFLGFSMLRSGPLLVALGAHGPHVGTIATHFRSMGGVSFGIMLSEKQ
jgi:hypothetical protein